MYDVIVIGTGAAGLSCALTLSALKKNFLWLGKKDLSFKIRSAEEIKNYPGMIEVSGEEMARTFALQIERAGISITEKTATGVYKMGDYFSVLCADEQFDSRAVVIACGVESVKPVKGELEFVGRGVSYCATCDGHLYKNKKIAVVCTDKELEHEVSFLADLAEKTYFFPVYKGVEVRAENVEVKNGMIIEIAGSRKVEKIVLKDGEIEVDGVFMLKKAVAPTVLCPGVDSEDGHYKVDRKMRTNLPGLFACGDCTGRPYQYAKAVGEGNVAAHAVVEYLAEK